MAITALAIFGDDPAAEQRIPLLFSYISNFRTDGQFIASGGIPAVDLALEHINFNSTILSNYTLGYTTVLNSDVSRRLKYVASYINNFRAGVPIFTM